MSAAFLLPVNAEPQTTVELAESVITPDFPRPLASPAQAEAAAARLAPRLFAQAGETDVVGAFPTQEFDWLRAAGLLTAGLPTSLGGAELHKPTATHSLLKVLQHIGRGNLAVGRVFEGHFNALQLIQQLGTAAQVASYAADARAGRLFGVWNTEIPIEGVHLEPLANGRYRLRGAKTFASGAGHVARPLITGAYPMGRAGNCLCCRPMPSRRCWTLRFGGRWACGRRPVSGPT
ncbi:acyl-CoA dehydrogenase family protein [Hymenobacter glacialis]|uniref:acyl-CoA dehydrogenase family protein n=1 Tax=Hymenobacter glacialis TaxID=1908236 RepID=UPI000A988E50|nr:acyl-CoA dehydrogenase family protein [Hymenobacter glacialis]